MAEREVPKSALLVEGLGAKGLGAQNKTRREEGPSTHRGGVIPPVTKGQEVGCHSDMEAIIHQSNS